MQSSRRFLSILDSSAPNIVDSPGDVVATLNPANRAKPKLVRLTERIFGSRKSRPTATVGRGTGSLDICLSSEQCRQDANNVGNAPGLSSATEVPLTASPRRPESRILAFLSSRLSDGSALAPSRSTLHVESLASSRLVATAAAAAPSQSQQLSKSQPQPQSQRAAGPPPFSGPSSSGGTPLCATAISAPAISSLYTVADADAAKPLAAQNNPSSIQILDLASSPEATPGPEPMTYHEMDTDAYGGEPYDVQGWRPVTPAQPAEAAAVVVPRAAGAAAGAAMTLRAQVAGDAAAAAAAFSRVRPHTQLLASCVAVPEAMRRPCWCLEDYAVDRRLYRSSTASVYSALCLRSGVPVALKVYNLATVPANVIHMLIREIKIQSMLVHKNIVMLYGAFQDVSSQRLVLVQELATNGDLQGVHRAVCCRMSEAQARSLVLRPLLEAVAHFHSLGIVHRDIKPENILFHSDWRLMVADFGVAIDSTEERAVTRAGTVGYMAPEVERCPLKMLPQDNKMDPSLAYTTAADIWGIGCLTYQLLLGFPPFVMGNRTNDLNHQNRNSNNNDDSRPSAASGAAPCAGRALIFPASTSPLARDFITSALAERPEDRLTSRQLLQHPWMQQQQPQQHWQQQQQQDA